MPHNSPGNPFSGTKAHGEIRRASPTTGAPKQVGWVKIGHFPQKTRYNSKTVQDRRIVSIKVE